jgi:hypothetical protein
MPGVAPANKLTVPLGLIDVILIDSGIYITIFERYLS